MSNPFELLGEDDDTFSVGDGEFSDIDFFKFESLVPEVKVTLNDSNFGDSKFKSNVSLLTCSSKYGFIVAGNLRGFIIGKTTDLRNHILKAEEASEVVFEDYTEVSVDQGSVNIVALTSDQLQLLVGVSGGLLLVYNIYDIVVKKTMKPILSHRFTKEIGNICPNPEAYPDLLAVCLANQDCHLFDLKEKKTMKTLSSVTAACWSKRGKQIACGFGSGRVSTYSVEGIPKDYIDPPVEMKANKAQEAVNRHVSALLWVENDIFFVIYSRPQNSEEPSHTPYIINRKAEREDYYLQLEQVSEFTTSDNRVNSHFYLELVRQLGTNIPFLITIANANSTALNLVGKEVDGKWSTWLIDDGGIPKLPTTSSFEDTFPIGLAVDYSSLESFTPDDGSEKMSPMPILYLLTNDGRIYAYHYYNSNMLENGETFENMVVATDIKLIPQADIGMAETKEEVSPENENKLSKKNIKKSTPEAISTRASKVPVMKTLAKSDETNKNDTSTSPTSSSYSGIPRLRHTSAGWGSLVTTPSTSTSSSVSAKSNVTPLHDVNTGATKKPETSSNGGGKAKASSSQPFGQSSNADLSSKTPFGVTSFVSKPKQEEAEAKGAIKPTESLNTDYSDGHSLSSSGEFVKISNNEETGEIDDIPKGQSILDGNADQNEAQDVSITQPASNQQQNNKKNTPQHQQHDEKQDSKEESVTSTSDEKNVDKVKAEQVTKEEPVAISVEGDMKRSEPIQKDDDTKEASTDSEQPNKEEPEILPGNSSKEDTTTDENRNNIKEEDLVSKDEDVNISLKDNKAAESTMTISDIKDKVAETVLGDNETKELLPKEEKAKEQEQEPVLEEDNQVETKPSTNEESSQKIAVETKQEVENKEVISIVSKEIPDQGPKVELNDDDAEQSFKKMTETLEQEVPKENEEMDDEPKVEAESQEDTDQEEFEKIEKPDTPEPAEEKVNQVPAETSNLEEKKPEPVADSDNQMDSSSGSNDTGSHEVKPTPKEKDVHISDDSVDTTEKQETESIAKGISTGSLTVTNAPEVPIEEDSSTVPEDNTKLELPVELPKSDQKDDVSNEIATALPEKINDEQNRDENKPDGIELVKEAEVQADIINEMETEDSSNISDDDSIYEAGEMSFNEEVEEEEPSATEEEEEEEEKRIKVESLKPKPKPKSKPEIFFSTYQKKPYQPSQSYQTTATHKLAISMENQYFDTLQVMEQLNFDRKELHHETKFLRQTETKNIASLDEEHTWKIGNINDLCTILKDLETQLTEAEQCESKFADINGKSKAEKKAISTFKKMICSIQDFDAAMSKDKSTKSKGKTVKSRESAEKKKIKSELVVLCKHLVKESRKLPIFDYKLYEDVQHKVYSQKPDVINTSLRDYSAYSIRHALRQIQLKLNNYLSELDSYEAKERLIHSGKHPKLHKASFEKSNESAFVVNSTQTDRFLGELFSLSKDCGSGSVKKTGFF